MSDVYEQWNRLQDEAGVPATLREATVIADLILKATGAPEELRARIEGIYDKNFMECIEKTEHVARMMVIVHKAIHDDDAE